MAASASHLDAVPLHRLFPAAYAETAREIRRDFLFFGTTIAGSLLFLRVLEMAIVG